MDSKICKSKLRSKSETPIRIHLMPMTTIPPTTSISQISRALAKPYVLANEIIEYMEAGLKSFKAIVASLK